MELGARIKSLRTQRGLSQEALAGQLEVSHQAVAKWESGKSQPSTANLRALCGVFGVSLDALVSGEEPAAPEPPPPAEASPRPRRAAPMVLSAITLLSFSFSVSATIYAGNRHFPEQVIGGADGPTSILVSGPYILGLPAEAFPLWVITAALALVTALVFWRGRRQ
ncbi:MAG: helix-turn-helix transcriptional regulator [Angelakisella sp.]|jgi:transcriptional regulator with XRE-family HTH domain|nr:helix-turn-helix transcriptional regulator [Angelakisella sp.]